MCQAYRQRENIIYRDLSIVTQRIGGKTQKNKGVSSVIWPQGPNFLPLLLECPRKAKADVAVVQIKGRNNGWGADCLQQWRERRASPAEGLDSSLNMPLSGKHWEGYLPYMVRLGCWRRCCCFWRISPETGDVQFSGLWGEFWHNIIFFKWMDAQSISSEGWSERWLK